MRGMVRPVVGLLRSALGTNGVAARLAAMEAAMATMAAPPPPLVAAPAAPGVDTNLMLHHARGAMMREMPPGARRLVSAGCSGTWYFAWVEQCYGPVPEHVGIEYYMPRPDDLPGNVTWIENTASDMAGLADGSADLMISGQNIEHLWPEEVAGFLMEAARVVRPGGTLAVDSPSRAITAPLNWSHPEHTMELTAAEMRTLMGLAGFEVTKAAGMWLCRDPRTGRMLPYDPNEPDADWSQTERLVGARDHPDDSFLWWIEGVRTTAAPDGPAITAMLDGLFAAAWPERMRRTQVPPGRAVERRDGREWVKVAAGQGGMALYGPYMPLKAGMYTVRFALDAPAGAGVLGTCEVVAAGRRLVAEDIRAGATEIALTFMLPALQFGMEFRCIGQGGGFAVGRHPVLEGVAGVAPRAGEG